jgi:DNA-binding FadR family transcriptional regulator
MKQTNCRRPLVQAIAHLNAAVANGRATPDRPLPGVRALARDARVSLVTMVTAVARAKHEGVLTTCPGRGTFVAADFGGGVRVPERARPTTALRWERAASRLRHDIATRAFAWDQPLPGSKELASRYGVSLPTLRKALTHLAETGGLAIDRGVARVAGSSATAHASICLVVQGTPRNPFETYPERDQVLLREFAAECRSRRIVLDYCFVDYGPGSVVRPEQPLSSYVSARPSAAFLGFAVLALAIDTPNMVSLIAQCSQTGQRVVVLEGSGELHAGSLAGRRNVTLVHFATSSACGLAVGRYLASLGHRHLLYLHRDRPEPWSHARFRGLRDSLVEADIDGQVRMVRVDEPVADNAAVNGFFSGASTRHIASARHRQAMDRALVRMAVPLQVVWREEMQREALHAGLAGLLRQEAATAWVAESGTLAVRCLRYLRQRRMRIPERLSLVGFDDPLDAQLGGITCYDFDMRAVAREAVDTLVSSRPKRAAAGRAAPAEVEVLGFLTVRATTGAAAFAAPASL